MRTHSSVVQEMAGHGRYLTRILTTDKLKKLNWLEFRHLVKVTHRLMSNLTDFNVVHFTPLDVERRRKTRKAERRKAAR